MQLCLEEFERLTLHDIEFNMEFNWLTNEMRNIFSGYLILNQQNKENGELSFKEQLNIIINPSQFLKDRIQNNILEQFKYAKLKYSTSSPRELVKATIFVSSLVFYLLVSYVMIFFSLLGKFNINLSFAIRSIFIFFHYIYAITSNFYTRHLRNLFNFYLNDRQKKTKF